MYRKIVTIIITPYFGNVYLNRIILVSLECSESWDTCPIISPLFSKKGLVSDRKMTVIGDWAVLLIEDNTIGHNRSFIFASDNVDISQKKDWVIVWETWLWKEVVDNISISSVERRYGRIFLTDSSDLKYKKVWHWPSLKW